MAKKKTDERRPCIYCARNKRTNKYYVGQTRYGLKHRQHQHLDRAYNKKRNTKFCKALRWYGQDNFVWETLYIVRNDDLSPEQLQSLLNMREKAWVKYFNSFENGYNQDEGGAGGVRYKYATLEEKEEAKRKGMKARREADPHFKQQRKEYRKQKEEANPELKTKRRVKQKQNRDNRRESYNEQRRKRIQAKGEAYREQRRKYIHQKFEDHPEIREQYNAAMKARREADPHFKQQRKEYRKQKEEANPELKISRLARQNAKRAANREAYRAAFNARRKARKAKQKESLNS